MPLYYSCNEIVRHLYVVSLTAPSSVQSPQQQPTHTEPDGNLTNDVLWGSVSDEQRVYCWVGSVCMVAEWFWYMVFQ
jgi:hypothetical protein